MPPEAGSFRVVYLADPAELQSIYAISPRSRGGICSTCERSAGSARTHSLPHSPLWR
jgi:hypothetical protein